MPRPRWLAGKWCAGCGCWQEVAANQKKCPECGRALTRDKIAKIHHFATAAAAAAVLASLAEKLPQAEIQDYTYSDGTTAYIITAEARPPEFKNRYYREDGTVS